MEQSVTELEASGARLSEYFDVDATAALAVVIEETSQPSLIDHDNAYPIQLVPVHTFILQGHTKDIGLAKGILVPSFASHWGVVVGDPGEYMLYHLVFRDGQETRNDGTSDTIRGKFREVDFHYTQWKNHEAATTVQVGQTRYSDRQLIRIGTGPFLYSFTRS